VPDEVIPSMMIGDLEQGAESDDDDELHRCLPSRPMGIPRQPPPPLLQPQQPPQQPPPVKSPRRRRRRSKASPSALAWVMSPIVPGQSASLHPGVASVASF
jgi:hypothetical protein